MKILHIGTGIMPILPDSGRSVENTIHQLSSHQAGLANDVKVIDQPRWCGRLVAKGFAGYAIKLAIFLPCLFVRLCFAGRWADVVHGHSQFPVAVAVMVKRLLKLRAPIFYTAHSPYLMLPDSLSSRVKHTPIEGWIIKRADRVVAQTESLRREMIVRYGLAPAKVVQVFAGIDLGEIDRFRRGHKQDKNSKVVFYPAYINRRKNQMAVVKAIPSVLKKHPDCQFVFAGEIEDGGYFSEIMESEEYLMANREGAWRNGSIQFVGKLSREDVYQHYMNATAVVFPTLAETQGMVLVEAMAFGTPVVASNIGVLTDMVKYKKGCALLVDPNDSRAIARGVVRILDDRELWNRLSLRGKELVNERFGWDMIAGEMVKEYEDAKRVAQQD